MSPPDRIACSAVAYHNTRPFLHGLQRSPLRERLDLQLDIPSEGAAKLRDGRVRLGLVPVAVLEHVPGARIESSLLTAIDGMPKLDKPDTSKPRLLNLRIYESHNERAGKKKIEMFNKGELAIFRRVGLTPRNGWSNRPSRWPIETTQMV